MTDHNYDYMAYLIGAEEFSKHKSTFPKGPFQKVVSKFYAGDRVRLKNGIAEIEITKIHFQYSPSGYPYVVYLDGKYVKSDITVTHRNQDDFVPYDGESKMTMYTNKLYTWKQTYTTLDVATIESPDLYGHYLATNSQGEWVMEVKGSGQIMAVTKDKVQEVLPYTIGVKFGKSSQVYHYLAERDKFPVGFYLVDNYNVDGFQVAQVVQVDTKSPKATVEFTPFGKLAVDLY